MQLTGTMYDDRLHASSGTSHRFHPNSIGDLGGTPAAQQKHRKARIRPRTSRELSEGSGCSYCAATIRTHSKNRTDRNARTPTTGRQPTHHPSTPSRSIELDRNCKEPLGRARMMFAKLMRSLHLTRGEPHNDPGFVADDDENVTRWRQIRSDSEQAQAVTNEAARRQIPKATGNIAEDTIFAPRPNGGPR